jgi:uncharacterized protein YcfJ|tara:strand:- start:25260 stop:25721 length:462 start_codon:yes stop_codon:yes gene_type:complete
VKNLLLVGAAALSLPHFAWADTAIKGKVRDHYKTVYEQVSSTSTECYNVDVPIYGTVRKNKAGEGALLGAILGGVSGKVITGDDGGAAVGALFGAIVGADKGGKKTETVITGYRVERQCNDVTEWLSRPKSVYSHSTVIFKLDGQNMKLEFYR